MSKNWETKPAILPELLWYRTCILPGITKRTWMIIAKTNPGLLFEMTKDTQMGENCGGHIP